jgi:hypothetical protein
MTNMQTNIRATIGKHQRAIMLTVAVVALAAYVVPFAHLYDVADAASKSKDKRPSHDSKKKDSKKDPSLTSVRVGLAQSAVLNSGILVGGGGSGSGGYEGFQLGNTAFNFILQNQQVCSGISLCSNTQTVDFRPYSIFGGAS